MNNGSYIRYIMLQSCWCIVIVKDLILKSSLAFKPICLCEANIHLQLTIYCSEAEYVETKLLRSWSPIDISEENGAV